MAAQNCLHIYISTPFAPSWRTFVYVPRISQPSLLSSERLSILRPKLQAPEPNGFVGDHDAAFREQILDISKAESESVLRAHRMADDFGRETVAFVARFHAAIVTIHADHRST
jgi:hypothetical protein